MPCHSDFRRLGTDGSNTSDILVQRPVFGVPWAYNVCGAWGRIADNKHDEQPRPLDSARCGARRGYCRFKA